MSYLDDLQDMVGAPDGTAEEKHRLALVDTFRDVLRVAIWVVHNHYNTIEHVTTTMDEKLRKSPNLFVSRVDMGATTTLTAPASNIHTVYEHYCRKHGAMPTSRTDLIRVLEGRRCRLVLAAGTTPYLTNLESIFGPAASHQAHKQLRLVRFHVTDLCKILEVAPSDLFPKRINVMLKEDYPYVAV